MRNTQDRPPLNYTNFAIDIKKYHMECSKLDIIHNISDARCWTAIVNPGKDNIIVSFLANKLEVGDRTFDLQASNLIISDILPEDIYDVLSRLTQTNTDREIVIESEYTEE